MEVSHVVFIGRLQVLSLWILLSKCYLEGNIIKIIVHALYLLSKTDCHAESCIIQKNIN
jgi:hypothetical protein